MNARTVIWTLAILLAVLHQDFWLWNDATLWFGFMPVGLLYHICFSIAAALLWASAVIWAWPSEVEEEVEEFLKANPEGASSK